MSNVFKKVSYSFLCIYLIMFFTGCNDGDTYRETENNVTSSYIYDVEIYSGTYGVLTLDKINDTGLVFNFKNTSDYNINPAITVSLDGEVVTYSSEYTLIAPGEEGEYILSTYEPLESFEHKFLSAQGILFPEGSSDNVTFDVCDLDLGGSEYLPDDLGSGEELYSTDNIIVEYLGSNAQGLSFTIDNKRSKSVNVHFEGLYINDDEEDYGIYSRTIPGHSKGEFSVDILTLNTDYFASDLEHITGCMSVIVYGEGVVDRFQFDIINNND